MAVETTETIVREYGPIEQYKLDLLETAKKRSQQDLNLPAFQSAGLSDVQKEAVRLGQQGIGAYAPFLQAGQQAVERGIGTLGAAQQAISGVNIAPQYQQALQGMAAGQQTAGMMGAGAGMVGQAAQMIPTQAQLGPSQQYLAEAARGATGASLAYDPRLASSFMDPYQQQVTQQALREMRRQGDIAQQGQAAQAIRSGAFGGTREGIQRAEMERGLQDVMSQRIAEDMSRNYLQAQQAAMGSFEQQQQRQLAGAGQMAGIGGTFGQQALSQAGLGQAGAGLLGQLGASQAGIYGQQAGLQGQLAQGIGSLASQYGQLGLQRGVALGDVGQTMGQMGMTQAQMGSLAQQAGQGDVNALLTLGGMQQQAEQARLDAFRATEMQKATAPYQNIAFLSDIYKGAPSSQMSVTAATAPTTSPLTQAIGLGISGIAAASGAQRAGIL